MRKFLIIGIIIIILIVGVSVFSCIIKNPTKTDSPVGGLYTGTIVAVGQNPDGTTTIYWADGKKPVTVVGWFQLAVGQIYNLQITETKDGLTITGIQMKAK
jgi:hypothetical protein